MSTKKKKLQVERTEPERNVKINNKTIVNEEVKCTQKKIRF